MTDDNEPGDPQAAPASEPAAGPAKTQAPAAGAAPQFEDMSQAGSAPDAPTVPGERTADDLEAVFDVPVRVSAVLGRTRVPVSALLKMDVGTVVELDRQVGEAIDIYVNDRLIARGEIVLVESRLGITMTEIIKAA